jgi:hypothetical protein
MVHTIGFFAAAVLAQVGAWLLTSPEGYPPADHADLRLRHLIRVWSFVPLLALVLQTIRLASISQVAFLSLYYNWPVALRVLGYVVAALFTVGLAPLPLLLFTRLRGLAKRARSAHLAEHCMIVGIGMSSAFALVGLYALIVQNAERLGFGTWWVERSKSSLTLVLIVVVAFILFTLWSLYLLVRFALAFRTAARELRVKWTAEDRALAAAAEQPATT